MRLREAGRATAALLGGGALLVALAGCGRDDDPYAIPDEFDGYCAEVEAQQTAISEALAGGGAATGLIQALPSFEALAAEAPDDIADDWELVITRVHDLVGALEAADVDPASYDRAKPPAGLDPEERQAIDAAASALASGTTANAMAGVQQHARDVCKTPLSL